jgi:hypothetical protein
MRRKKHQTDSAANGQAGVRGVDNGAVAGHSVMHEAKYDPQYDTQSPAYSPTLASTSPGLPPKSPEVHYASFPAPGQISNMQPPLVGGGGYQSHSPVPMPPSHTPIPSYVSELPSDSHPTH